MFGIPIIINELYKCNTGYVTLWTAADVLSFYSVIFSGVITIGALIVTIYYSKKDTEKHIRFSQSQTNVPFFIIEKVSNNTDELYESQNGLTWENEYIINRYENHQEQVTISLTNIGEGMALSPNYVIDLLPNNNNIILPIYVSKGKSLDITYNLHSLLKLRFNSSTVRAKFESFDACIKICYQNTSGIKFSQIIILQHNWVAERNSVIIRVNSASPQNIEL